MCILVGPGKHVVDDVHELHDPLVQVEVLEAFEQVGVLAAIGTNHGYLLWLGLGRKYCYLELE